MRRSGTVLSGGESIVHCRISKARQKGIAGKKARIDTLSGLYFWLSGGYIKEKQRLLAPMLESIKL